MSEGTVEKAMLYIHLKNITASESGNGDTNEEFNSFYNDLISNKSDDLKSNNIATKSGADKIFKFTVQYNPATISFSTSNSMALDLPSENDKKTKYRRKRRKPEESFSADSTLSFNLIFDDCNGVRKKMDSIMSLLSSSFTQQVIFYWANMIFRGTVTNVSNTYNMFDSKGVPIRGTMNLSISQKTNDTVAGDKKYWDDAFNFYFKSHKSRKSIKNDPDGAVEKAVLEIADFSKREVEKNDAAAPNKGKNAIGSSSNKDAKINFNKLDKNVSGDSNESFAAFNDYKKYRFECQFNPEQLSLSGSGSLEMPSAGRKARSANTKINLSFTLIFDKTDNLDSDNCSVKTEVEALTAIVRDEKKQMATFTWGDKSYQGAINSVNAEYKMFNHNCEPVRASVAIGMTVYDESVSGALSDIWAGEYMKDIYNAK